MGFFTDLHPPAVLRPRGFFQQAGTAHILVGETRAVMRRLPANSYHCAVTSPPYFGHRDYRTGTWTGGDVACDHVERFTPQHDRLSGPPDRSRGEGKWSANSQSYQYRSVCGKCGAIRADQQIGQEETVEQFVSNLVEVCREVRRLLRNDGTLWLNLGDSYASQGGTGQQRHWDGRDTNHETQTMRRQPTFRPGAKRADGVVSISSPRNRNGVTAIGYKVKDLIGVPWRVALALQDDGWWLRSDVIWHKPNALPESVDDRPTTAHEYIFMLTKSSHCYYDNAAVAVPAKEANLWSMPTNRASAAGRPKASGNEITGVAMVNETVALRNVWTIPTGGPGDGNAEHAATYPEALPSTCIKASTSEKGCCPQCGAPWQRVVKQIAGEWRELAEHDGDGWAAGCDCPAAEPVPCWVLDPFGGMATSGLAAGKLGRHSTMIELSPKWAAAAQRRLETQGIPVEPRIGKVRRPLD